MHLQFVGCGDAFGSGGRFNTCFHLVGKNTNALIDCGATSLVGMNKLAIDRNAIETIFISHFHADHIFGLPFFLLEANYVSKRTQPLTIVGPPGLKTRLPEVMECGFPGSQSMELNFALTLRELDIGKHNQVGRVGVTPFHVKHDDRAGPCLGFRFEVEDKVIAFSGDTEWTEALIEIGREADLFICEAYTWDKPITTHMALAMLKQHLGQIKPKRVVLTHMSEDMLKHRIEPPYEAAEDGKIVEI